MIIRLSDEKKKLDTVFVTDFGDAYHDEATEPATELESQARRIRRKYKDPIDYIIAKAVYKQYMEEEVYSLYPTKSVAKATIDEGMHRGFIPPKPSMKRGTDAYKLMKQGIFTSRVNWKKVDQPAMFAELTERLQEHTEYTGPAQIKGVMPNKKFDKLMDGVVISNNTGNSSTLGKNVMKTDEDLINEYFERKARKNGTIKQADDTEWDPETYAISDLMDDDYYDDLMSDEDDDTPVFANGRYMTRIEREENKVFEELHDLGWDSIKLMKASGSKLGEESRIAKITKRREKKLKKRQKDVDKKLMKSMGKGNYKSFDEYEDQMLNFTFRD